MHQVHAAVLHGIGQTPRYEPFPAPSARDGEAVVTVTAAALKPSDRLMASGVGYAPRWTSRRYRSPTWGTGWPRAGSDGRIVFVP
jgi:NADPH:quinone reductase-like Zn-dependent oxidoreductase